MCGLFGFAGNTADVDFLTELGALAARRGPEMWGVAGVRFQKTSLDFTPGVQVSTRRHAGTFDAPAARAAFAEWAENGRWDAVIGNCRLYSSGVAAAATADAGAVPGGQPMMGTRWRPGAGGYEPDKGFWYEQNPSPYYGDRASIALVHNGNVPDYKTLTRRWGVGSAELTTGSDSEALTALYQVVMPDYKTPEKRLAAVLKMLPATVPLAILALTDDDRLLIARRGLPLYHAVRPQGHYYVSVPPPEGGAALLPEGVVLSRRHGTLWNRSDAKSRAVVFDKAAHAAFLNRVSPAGRAVEIVRTGAAGQCAPTAPPPNSPAPKASAWTRLPPPTRQSR